MSGVGHEVHPTVSAQEVNLTLKVPLSASELLGRIDAFMSGLTCSLQADGCKLIGHIKGLLEVEGNGHLFFSITSFEDKVRYRGELTHEIARAKLTINVIVYGVEQRSVERAVREGLERHVVKGCQG
jgi:hypothetical protein